MDDKLLFTKILGLRPPWFIQKVMVDDKAQRVTVYRQSMRKRLQAKLAEVKTELRRRMCRPVPEVCHWLASVLTGHYRYYGVPMNTKALWLFRYRLGWLWPRSLSRRSQKAQLSWQRMARLIDRYLPNPRIYHDYPLRRLGVII